MVTSHRFSYYKYYMKQFDSLCDTFNMNGVSDSVIDEAIAPKSATVPEPEPEEDVSSTITYKGQKYTLASFRYMKTTLQQKIEADEDVLETLRQTCKVGAPPRLFEVYATLSNTVASHLKQLQDMEKVMTDYQVTEEKEKMQRENMAQKERLLQLKAEQGPDGVTYNIQNNNNLFLTGEQLDDMIDKADEDKRINTEMIGTDFNLD